MARRLNDTAAVTRMGPGGQEETSSTSVSVRRIDNGYVKSVCTYGPEQEYKSTETFSTERPDMSENSQERSSGSSSLSNAIAFLNR